MNETLLNVIQKDLPAFLQQLDKKRISRPGNMLERTDIAYLETLQGNKSQHKEQVSLYLLLAYGNCGIGEPRMAIHYFEQAFILSDDYIPQGSILAKAYLGALHTVVAQTGDVSLLSNGLEWAEKFEFITFNVHKELAAIYYQAKDYDTAASLWTQHLQNDPHCVSTTHILINTLLDLRRYEAAIAVYKNASAVVQEVSFLQLLAGHCYKATGEYAEAEKLYKAAMAAPYNPRCLPMCALAALYAESNTDHSIAHTLLLFMEQQLNYNYPRLTAYDLNRVAWRLYLLNTRLDLALKFSRRAVEQAPYARDYAHTLVALMVRLREWEAVTPHVERWLQLSDDDIVKTLWNHYSLVFQDAIIQDQQVTLGMLLTGQASECWRAIRCALYKTSEFGEMVEIPEDICPVAEQLYKQFVFRDMPRIFPT